MGKTQHTGLLNVTQKGLLLNKLKNNEFIFPKCLLQQYIHTIEIGAHERFEVFMAVTMKNAIFWDVTPCGTVRTNISKECIVSIITVTRISELGTMLAVTSSHACCKEILCENGGDTN
jgi:hypothetical protein